MNLLQNYFLVILLVVIFLFMGGCAHKATLDDMVHENNFIKTYHRSQYFSHITLRNQLYYSKNSSTLYVFIEGDGLPWKTRSQISVNPDPIYPLALDLMSKNKQPSIYISRPCYQVRDNRCQYQWWTNKRYSKQVVESMISILHEVSVGFDEITIVGYSGGGTLAALIANSFRKVTKLVTLAGNMNHLKWTKQHNYSRLTGSLNPDDYILPPTVSQFHYAAENDKNILPGWIKEFSDKQTNSQFILLKNADHRCCWVNSWQRIINQVNK